MCHGEWAKLERAGRRDDVGLWNSTRCSQRKQCQRFAHLQLLLPLAPSFLSCRIKLHLLQILHHGGKHSDVSEDDTKEWVAHLFQLLSTAVPPYLSLSPLCPFIFLYSSVIFLSSPPMILSSSVFLLRSLFTSLPHCFRLAIVCSVSVWNLFRLHYVQVSLSFQSNLSFYWQLHNVLRSQSKALNEERQMYFKISLFAVVTSLTSYGLNVVI